MSLGLGKGFWGPGGGWLLLCMLANPCGQCTSPPLPPACSLPGALVHAVMRPSGRALWGTMRNLGAQQVSCKISLLILLKFGPFFPLFPEILRDHRSPKAGTVQGYEEVACPCLSSIPSIRGINSRCQHGGNCGFIKAGGKVKCVQK